MNETELNIILAKILDAMHADWSVKAERTGVIEGEPGKRPDIIITERGVDPVVIEVEWEPGRTVEKEAKERLYEIVEGHGEITTSVTLVIPKRLKHLDSKHVESLLTAANDLRYAIHFQSEPRFPLSNWLQGSLASLTSLIQMSFPAKRIERSVQIMESSINKNSVIMEQETIDTKKSIGYVLKQDANKETFKMASLILQNAMLFYDQISGTRKIPHMRKLRLLNDLNYDLVVNAWKKALEIDYWPIFKIALDLLECFSCDTGNRILKNVDFAVRGIVQLKMSRSGDMHGILFQRLVKDRKQLAAFYTLPESATLLASVAVPIDSDPMWRDSSAVKHYVVADLACGTGMLLSAAYKRMIANYGINYNSMRDIHSHMIANNLIGYDVLPIATHITAAGLAGMFPRTDFDTTRIKVLKLGRFTKDDYEDDENDLVSADVAYGLGSLGLMRVSSVLRKTDHEVHARGTRMTKFVGIPDRSCRLIIMNPPFTRNNRQGVESDKDALIPAFGVFGISEHDQDAMRKMRDVMYGGSCAAGHAGTASYFIALADAKLDYGGRIAIVVLSSITSGSSWKKVREMLELKYKNITMMSINADTGVYESAFSADTKMSEVMIVAEKRLPSEVTRDIKTRMINVSLSRRPRSKMEAIVIGDAITHYKNIPQLESGVYGVAELNIGDTKLGEMLNCPFSSNGTNYNNIKDMILLQFAYRLSRGALHLPNGFESSISMTTVKSLVKTSKTLGGGGAKPLVGPDSQMLIGRQQNGPFKRSSNVNNPTYPALWENNGDKQTRLVVEPDSSLIPKNTANKSTIAKYIKYASRIHYNNFLSYGSQKLLVMYTKTPMLGGVALPSMVMKKPAYEKAFAVWSNSTLGLLCNWLVAGRQQRGRSIIRLKHALNVPVLDLEALAASKDGTKKLSLMSDLFDSIQTKNFKSIRNLHCDPLRIELDKRLLDIIDMDVSLSEIRWKFASEPHIHNGRPPVMDSFDVNA